MHLMVTFFQSLQTAKSLQLQMKPMKAVPWTSEIPSNTKNLQKKIAKNNILKIPN